MSCPTSNFFTPSVSLIESITNSTNGVVTTTEAHGYVTNEVVRFFIPLIFGMQELNGRQCAIEVLSSTSFATGVNTLNFDAFSSPSPLPSNYTCPQVISEGQVGTGILCAVQNTGET